MILQDSIKILTGQIFDIRLTGLSHLGRFIFGKQILPLTRSQPADLFNAVFVAFVRNAAMMKYSSLSVDVFQTDSGRREGGCL